MNFKKLPQPKEGEKEDVNWSDDLAEELHKPIVRRSRKRRVEVRGVDKIWAADLADMQAFSKQNDGVKYILCVIDIFSRYGWMRPLEDKTGTSVAKEFANIFKISGRKPENIWVDKGKEFLQQRCEGPGYGAILH